VIIELGGGPYPLLDADIVLDTRYPVASPAQDVAETPWRGNDGPLPNECADEVYASNLMEHIPHGEPTLAVMNEAWRVLQPGGVFTMLVPIVGMTLPGQAPALLNHWAAYADPTHVAPYWAPESLALYYCLPDHWAAMYGAHPWQPMGPYIPDWNAIDWTLPTFWSIRYGYEATMRIQK
jgi:SAM-dependent methyltransferase